MSMGRDSVRVKREFGSFLKERRLEKDWGVYDVGRMVGATQQTVFYWEAGHSFPASVVRLKKLCLLYEGVPETVKGLARALCPNGKKWREFEARLGDAGGAAEPEGRPKCYSVSNDGRDTKYKVAFGEYLRRERAARGLGLSALSEALGLSHNRMLAWEAGSNFPSSVVVMAMLDRLYGNLFDVLFGLCRKHGIHLEPAEVREVLEARDEIDGMGRWGRGKGGLWRKT